MHMSSCEVDKMNLNNVPEILRVIRIKYRKHYKYNVMSNQNTLYELSIIGNKWSNIKYIQWVTISIGKYKVMNYLYCSLESEVKFLNFITSLHV